MNTLAESHTDTTASVSLTEFDARADGAARHVAIGRHGVAITRRYRGIDMRLAVPLSAYRGIVLTAQEADNCIEVRLTHDDPDLSIVLARDEAAEAMIEEGQCWARALDLPMMVEGNAGNLYPIAANQPNPASTDRRGGHALSHRRPRFLLRRKAGERHALPVVHRGEREIIATR